MENTQRAALFRVIALASLFSLAWAGLDTCPGVLQCRAECPPGFGISKANPKLCMPCGAGTFKKSSGNRECALCSAGSYASKTGSTSCTKCPAGSFADEKGSSTCKKCAPGTYSSAEGATECKVCDWKVSLKRYEGMTKCDLCPDSWYSLGSDKCHLRIGCFNDDFPRDLPIQKIFSTDNTPLRCAEYCKSKGFSYAGVQSQKDCFCGNSYGKYGKVKDSECSLKCTGDSRLTCGHESKNEIYHTGLQARLGCFKDEHTERDLPVGKMFSSDNTPLRCAEYCKSKGYFYAGVQSNDGCFCGNSYGKYGKLKDSECSLKCTGDIKHTCGGHMKNEVYYTGHITRFGCFKEGTPRDLPVEKVFSTDNTPLRCAEYCKSKGYLYAAVQSNDECYCGNSYGKYGKLKDSECTLKCTGDSTQYCGDHMKNEVYYTGLLTPLGCFEEGTPRDLPDEKVFSTDNTPLRCAEHCKSKGYLYAAVQSNDECYCGNSYGKYGKLKDSECTLKCTGDSTQTCGDHMKNEIYHIGLQARLGCFKDEYHERDMPVHTFFSADNTPLRCIEYCKSQGYLYAAVQSNDECFCGNSYGKYGKVKDSECSLKCTGDSKQTCGDHMKNEVFYTGLQDVILLGCFKDQDPRDLPVGKVFSTDNTPLRCAEYCKSQGYLYAGVQSNDECYCGNSYGKYGKPDSECTLRCTGDSKQYCGGHWKSEIYNSGLSIKVQNEHACEHKTLKINCPAGHVIRIVKGFYGRIHDQFCPRETDDTHNCSNQLANEIIESKCNNKRSCSVESSNSVFGDPCPGIVKYTSVEYLCYPRGE